MLKPLVLTSTLAVANIAYAGYYPLTSLGQVTSMFEQNSYNSLPSNYFLKENNESYVLIQPNGTDIKKTAQWIYSFDQNKVSVMKYYSPKNGFPSFTEFTSHKNQCVAFVKAATNSFSMTTDSWHKGDYIIPNYVSDAVDYKHKGKIIAYFGNNLVPWGAKYSEQLSLQPKYGYNNEQYGNHVGIFLGYEFDNPTYPTKVSAIWIADQNSKNDGKIRKRRIEAIYHPNGNPSYDKGRYNANNYSIVNIKY